MSLAGRLFRRGRFFFRLNVRFVYRNQQTGNARRREARQRSAQHRLQTDSGKVRPPLGNKGTDAADMNSNVSETVVVSEDRARLLEFQLAP